MTITKIKNYIPNRCDMWTWWYLHYYIDNVKSDPDLQILTRIQVQPIPSEMFTLCILCVRNYFVVIGVINKILTATLQWSHISANATLITGNSIVFPQLVGAIIKENIKASHYCFCVSVNHRWAVDSPYKMSVRKALPCHGVVMIDGSPNSMVKCILCNTGYQCSHHIAWYYNSWTHFLSSIFTKWWHIWS